MTGGKYIGAEREQIDTSMVQVDAATKGLQEGLKKVNGWMDGQDNRQTQHEEVTSDLHQTVRHRALRWIRGSSYPTFAHKPLKKT